MTREELLDAVKEVVVKHRTNQYGTPEDSFANIAQMWSAYKGVEFTSYDVANMMILLKVVRCGHSPDNPDHYLDIAGYAACGCEVATKKPEAP